MFRSCSISASESRARTCDIVCPEFSSCVDEPDADVLMVAPISISRSSTELPTLRRVLTFVIVSL